MSRLKTVTRVLNIKDREKEEIEFEVRKLRSEIRQLECSLDLLEKKFGETTGEFEEKQRDRAMDVHKLELFYNYFMRLNDEMNEQKKEIVKRLSDLNKRQSALLEAYREKKLFEILKDRIEKEDMTLKDKAEQKEQDFQYLAKRLRDNK
jgi:flagellar export protein FliJ